MYGRCCIGGLSRGRAAKWYRKDITWREHENGKTGIPPLTITNQPRWDTTSERHQGESQDSQARHTSHEIRADVKSVGVVVDGNGGENCRCQQRYDRVQAEVFKWVANVR